MSEGVSTVAFSMLWLSRASCDLNFSLYILYHKFSLYNTVYVWGEMSDLDDALLEIGEPSGDGCDFGAELR